MMGMSGRLARILLCAAAVYFIFWGRALSVPVTMHEPLSIAMQATGAETSMVYITGNGKIPVADQNADGLKRVVVEAAQRLGLENGSYELEDRFPDTRQGVSLFACTGNTQIMVWARRQAEDGTGENRVELMIKIVEKMPKEQDIIGHKDRIYATIQNFKATPRITTCLEGYLDGKLRNDEWTVCLRDAFDAIGAGIYTVTDGEAYASYAGYSPLIGGPGIAVGGDRININMAMRYHSFDRRTYVVIGSPAIAIEY